jgi:hypothetical protein
VGEACGLQRQGHLRGEVKGEAEEGVHVSSVSVALSSVAGHRSGR